jgi:signal transduction histidine kinase/ActR/RegA family two-component response regulator
VSLRPTREALRRRIIGGGLALIVAIVGSAAYDGWRLHQQLMSASERELGNLAHALADQVGHSLQAVDVLLRETSSWYDSTGHALAGPAVEEALSSRAVGVSQVSVLTLVDAAGRQRHRSRATGEPLADVSDRPYFQAQRKRPDAGMFINEPIVTRTEGLPALVVSRRLERPDGRFDGVVTAIVTVSQLQQMFGAIQLGEGSALLLTLDDGTLVVRQPPTNKVPAAATLRYLVALKGGALVDHAVSPIDDRAKLVAAVGVRDQPLTLAVTRDEARALAPWRDEMHSAIVRTATLSVLVLLTVLALLRQLQRLHAGEQALRQSEQRYAMAMAAADEGHGEWNLHSGGVFASARWCALHDLQGEPPQTYAEIARRVTLHPDDAEPVRHAVDEHLAGRSAAIEVDYRVRVAVDGAAPSWRWIHARGRCERDAHGKPQRLFCAATDVTARKHDEAERLQLQTRLQQTQRMEALGTLAGGIAHDFNNILGAILGFGEMAQRQTVEGQPIRRHLDRVLQAGARARLLVRRILDFSRSGVSERVPVNLQAVVEEVVAMLAPALPAGVHITADLQAGSAAVLGDATQLYQVVMNLCTNATRAMGDSGELRVSVRSIDVVQATSLFQGELRAGSYLCVAVADSGAGIPADLKARIFEPFFTTGKVGEGTGLGLSVVHGIVADMAGAIELADRPGGGTLVSVWLPVHGTAARVLPTLEGDWPRGEGQVVMLVDDEPALLELAEEVLAGLGYEPVGFATAEAALQAFETDPARFDAVITDEMLPGLSGSALALRLRAMAAELPLVLMSGRVDAALEERARAAGIGALLHKPLALGDLADCLARLLGPPSDRPAAAPH